MSIWMGLLLLATLVNLGFWAGRFRLLAQYPGDQQELGTEEKPVSVIICAQNEAENLRKNLPAFLEQNYGTYEVLVVDDHSSDETSQIVLDIRKKYSNLALLQVKELTPAGKKTALSRGILSARFDWLIFSDADCCPTGPDWLRRIQRPFHHGKTMVLGYGPYQKRSGWLNRWIRFEAFYTAIQYLSFALARDPYMGVGRNLAYHRSLFRQAAGFKQHEHLISGDDDLFVNQVAQADHTSIIIDDQAHVHSAPETSWRGYYRQKRRHLSVGRHYRWKHQIALGALSLSHVGFYSLLLVNVIVYPPLWLSLIAIYLVRIGVILRVSRGISRHLGEQDLLPFLPLLDLALAAYYLVFVPSLLTGSRIQQWK